MKELKIDTPKKQKKYEAIAAKYLRIHDALTDLWLEAGKPDDTNFKMEHDQNWRDMDNELMTEGLIIEIPEPPDIIEEIKARLDNLEKG